MEMVNPFSAKILNLNVGGDDRISISQDSLLKYPDSFIAKFFSDQNLNKREDGKVNIDREPEIFKMVLTFLKTGMGYRKFTSQQQKELYLQEIKFWGLKDEAY